MYSAESPANCIILHNFSAQIDAQDLFEYLENFFNECNIIPTHMEYDSPHLPRSRSIKTFKHGKKSLYKIEFKDVENFCIYAFISKDYSSFANTIISTMYSTNCSGLQFSLIFDEAVRPFSVELINKLIKEISLILKPKYGYFLQRSFLLGPLFYASGVLYGDNSFINQEKITQWAHATYSNGKYKIGKLRDIYCCNVIGDVHLNQPALGTTLGKWIQSDASHGTLTPLTPELYAWWVEPEQIEPIRHALKDTGLIICDYDLKNPQA